MSSQEGRSQQEAPEARAWRLLEGAVLRAEERLLELGAQVEASRFREGELKELLRRFTEGEEDPGRLLGRLRTLEEENRMLRDRIRQGKEGVERLLARIRFLEEQG